MLDTGYLVDKTLKGGRVGLYAFSQSDVTWNHLSYKANGRRALVTLFLICIFLYLIVLVFVLWSKGFS